MTLSLACCRFCGHEDRIVTKELEITKGETEVQPRVQDRGCQAGDRAWRRGGQAARNLDVAESVVRRWMRELTAAPVAAFSGNGQMRADLAEIASLKRGRPAASGA